MTRRLRVLVIPSWYPSPESPTAGIFIRQQVDALKAFADVAVLFVDKGCADAPARIAEEDGVTVVRASIAATNLYDRFFAYRRAGLAAYDTLVREWGAPDVVHVQALWPAGLIGRAISRRYGIPYVVTEHSEEYSAATNRRLVRTPGMVPLVLRPLALGSSRTIAVSRFLGSRLEQLGLARDLVVIPNVVPECEPAPRPAAVDTTAPATTTAPARAAIAHVSVMGPAKNIEGLLRAIDRLRAKRSDFVLRLVGDGELRAQLEGFSAELRLTDVVEFTGRLPVEGVHRVLAESAFAVISSLHETFSVSAAEALMCGRPVLSTRCGGPEEFVTPDVGRLVDAGSIDALVEGLDWMLDHYREFDPEALQKYARDMFAPDVVAARILDVYREVLDA